jgi:hypothetical protein
MRMKLRSALAGGVAMGLLLTACGSSPSAPKALARGHQGKVASIPWSNVDSGWLLATWSPNKGTAAGEQAPGNVPDPVVSLFLVDPKGGRYLVWKTRVIDDVLSAWSGDLKRALFVSGGAASRFVQVDLKTGVASDLFTIPPSNTVFFESVSYTRPDGLALLVTTQTNDLQLLQRFSLDGTVEFTYPNSFSSVGRYDGHVLSTPDGTKLVMGAAEGVAVVANDGAVVMQIHVPGVSACTPTSWWSAGTVLASCFGASSSPRLYEIPINGGAVTALTVTPKPPDAGDLGAWKVGHSTYVQDAGGCGYIYLAKLRANGSTTPIAVPHVVAGDSIYVLGEANKKLALQATVACGGGQSALWFNPLSDHSWVVLGPPLNGGGVIAALADPNLGM